MLALRAAQLDPPVDGIGRVAIIDFDVHHGNGTQAIFYADPSVFYASSHQFPFYPGTGAIDERGTGAGLGYTLNVPLAAGAKNDVFLRAYADGILPAVEAFKPDIVLVSAGFDAHERDLFDQLITVKNVGPSTAIAILSGAGPRDIAALIAREDVPGLTKIKGIGKKTAEMLVVELREKCEMMVMSWNLGGTKPVAAHAGSIRTAKATRHPMLGEVMTALVNMGWKPAEAEARLQEVRQTAGSMLAGAINLTEPVAQGSRMLYRARFAGLEAGPAAATCSALRRQRVDCFVTRLH